MNELPINWLKPDRDDGENIFKFYYLEGMKNAYAVVDGIKDIILTSPFVESIQLSLHTFNVMVSIDNITDTNRADVIALAYEIEAAIDELGVVAFEYEEPKSDKS